MGRATSTSESQWSFSSPSSAALWLGVDTQQVSDVVAKLIAIGETTVPPERMGSASGLLTTTNAIAASLGIAILGTILRTVAGTSALRGALSAAVAVIGAGVLASFAIPDGPDREPSERVGVGTSTGRMR
jgi:hypothetical protein